MAQAKVHITLKQGVLDPQGKTIRNALQSLGYTGVEDVRVGKYIEIRMADGDRAELEKLVADMCRKLLANPVIEDYRLEVD